jgi:hypothetical protein
MDNLIDRKATIVTNASKREQQEQNTNEQIDRALDRDSCVDPSARFHSNRRDSSIQCR